MDNNNNYMSFKIKEQFNLTKDEVELISSVLAESYVFFSNEITIDIIRNQFDYINDYNKDNFTSELKKIAIFILGFQYGQVVYSKDKEKTENKVNLAEELKKDLEFMNDLLKIFNDANKNNKNGSS